MSWFTGCTDGATKAPPAPQRQTRWMIQRDLRRVVEIEESSFNEGLQWTQEDFLVFLRRRNVVGYVAELDGKVVGLCVYETCKGFLRIINMAVDPEHRGKGVARQMMEKFIGKLSQQHRSHIVALVPKSLEHVLPFFRHYGELVRIGTCGRKGFELFDVAVTVMGPQDAPDAQLLENAFFEHYEGKSRDIARMLDSNTRYGLVARDSNGRLLGHALYERTAEAIMINGEYGLIVYSDARRRGVGRKLMGHLASFGLPVNVCDINLLCGDQCAFLRAMGVAVPELQKYANAVWDGKPIT